MRPKPLHICYSIVVLLFFGLCLWGGSGRNAWEIYEAHRDARIIAINDWEIGTAVLYGTPKKFRDGVSVRYYYDLETGLPIEVGGVEPLWVMGSPWLTREFNMYLQECWLESYCSTIAELYATRGAPEWSMKGHVVSEDVLIDYVSGTEMPEIHEFPSEPIGGFIFMLEEVNGTTNLCVYSLAYNHKIRDLGPVNAPIYATIDERYPRVVLVRIGSKNVFALYANHGRLICKAERLLLQ